MSTGDRLAFAVATAEEAGALVLELVRRGEAASVDFKGRRNLVTAADRASEELITRRIREAYPDDGLEAEEGGGHEGTTGFVWSVDPVDGTTNFAHGHPFWAVSVGVFRDEEPVLGAVRAPRLDETFAGELGGVATRNGRPIRVSGTTELIRSLLATGFAYNRNEVEDDNVANFGRLLMECQGLRRAGAASLDLAYVAAGILDGFWELYLEPWDVCAGAAIVRAAGGTVTDLGGGEDFLHGGRIVASNGSLHEAIRMRLE
jgi:myo-inositol-1(or 4)-monophosphatase